MHVLLVERRREELDVATTTVDVLFMFDLQLDNEGLVLVAEWIEFGGDGVEPRILTRLETCETTSSRSTEPVTCVDL